jgi:hypothetical protein
MATVDNGAVNVRPKPTTKSAKEAPHVKGGYVPSCTALIHRYAVALSDSDDDCGQHHGGRHGGQNQLHL